MKTVKRKANVGERVLSTCDTFYGILCEVTEVKTSAVGANVLDGGWPILLNDEEYEVIIEEANEMGVIEQMQTEINELKSKVAALEGGNTVDFGDIRGEFGVPRFISFTKSPQHIRDEIVAKAKADVKFRSNQWTLMYADVEFVINREKRTVVALIRQSQLGGFISNRGIAKADPSDCFNVHIGKAIALRRALGLEVPAEYYNAPAPTEVRVGDVIVNLEGRRFTAVKDRMQGVRDVLTIDYIKACGHKVIDDSREVAKLLRWYFSREYLQE